MSKIEVLSPAAPVSMANEWFEIATAEHFWMRWRHSVLLRQLDRARFKPANALEIGCGHGVTRQMLERDLQIPVDGCDLNVRAIEMADPGKGRLFVYDIFSRNSSLLEAYDMLLLMDVIEHIDSDVDFVEASLAHLRPGGMLAVNVPAHMCFLSKYDRVAGHKRRYSAKQLRSLFKRAGISSVKIVEWGFFMIPLLFARKLLLRRISQEQTIRAGFDATNRFVGGLCEMLRAIELSLPFSPPMGTSLLALGLKDPVRRPPGFAAP